MSTVSLYPHIKETKKGKDLSIHDVLEEIRSGKWQDKIENLRSLVKSDASESDISKAKSKLPYFTASGQFTTRNDAGLVRHSGKLAIDFDKLEKYTSMDEAIEVLQNDKYSEYVFKSCTERGICVIVDIKPETHLESFLFLEKYYKEIYGLEIDKGCKDISRPRFISYDSELFHNENYEQVRPIKEYNDASYTIDSDDEKYEWVKNVHEKKQQFIEGNRHNYLVILAFFLNKCGVSQSYTLNRFMSEFLGNGKDEKEIERIVRDCYKGVDAFGTYTINKRITELPPEFAASTKAIYAHAFGMNSAGRMWDENEVNVLCNKHLLGKDIVRNILKNVFESNKDEFDIENKSDIYKVELFIKKRYSIRKNEVTTRTEIKYAKGATLHPITVDTIARDLMHANIKFALDKLKSLLRSNFVELYNPFKEYFEGLTEYSAEEEIDYIQNFSSFIKTDNQQFWEVQFKKALVRSIACALDYKENRIIMTLVQQSQETGKTSFIRFLCPDKLKDYYTETHMEAGKTDSDLQLSENFIWNIEELAALHSNEVNKLKATISKSVVKQRRSYGEFHETNPRRVSFWASTNKPEFLTDDTNTRWLCFNILGIDHDYNNTKTGVKKVNIDNVWAQAYTLYKQGFDYTLTKEEAQQRDALNKDYELSSVEKDLILSNFSISEKDNGYFMTPTDILIKLQQVTDNKLKLNIFAINRAMRQLDFVAGFKKINGKTVRGFFAKEITTMPGVAPVKYDEDLPF
jgi:predicted P-loop ATPase